MITPARIYYVIVCCAIIAGLCYGILYFNYLETPTEDYIGNIRPRVVEYLDGRFPGTYFKILPAYPLVLTAITAVNPMTASDPIYLSAMLFNIALLAPFLLVVFLLYRKFLEPWTAAMALVFLAMNPYTIYGAVNSELEMMLALLTALAMILSLNGSPFAYPVAFLTAATKIDSLFAVPASMVSDFFDRKRFLFAIVAGSLAASGVALWLLMSMVSADYSNPYLKEIASRGPNIYRFIADCFLVLSGYVPWMAMHAYHAPLSLGAASLYLLAAVTIALVVCATLWGGGLQRGRRWRRILPLGVFFSG
jgi:hypothetical protein